MAKKTDDQKLNQELGDESVQTDDSSLTQTAQDDPADQKLEQLEVRIKQLEDQLKRALADYQNLEKRVVEGRSELSTWATSELLKKIVPVLDYLDKALVGSTDQDKESGWFKGVQMAVKQLNDVLKQEGLEEIKCDGEFNPSLHEAVDMKDGEDNMILEVAEKGYNLHGKVLRPAKVVVGRRQN